MRFFFKRADGGENSGVTGYFLVEWKRFFSIGLLRFSEGSRENYHSHAFNALTWWLKGSVTEEKLVVGNNQDVIKTDYKPSFFPKYTPRTNFHKIIAHKPTWALTFRGPWLNTWAEFNLEKQEGVILTHGRKEVTRIGMKDGKLTMWRNE